MNKKYDILYEPRVQDPVVVASFDTRSEAVEYMYILQASRPKTHKFFRIVEKG